MRNFVKKAGRVEINQPPGILFSEKNNTAEMLSSFGIYKKIKKFESNLPVTLVLYSGGTK